ncbi:hypothetical protein M2277_005064 [Paenibacillus sp. LBL]|uniref:hypothetical protein n=1 Tax=Paenibacillus sp. LBL TaxID=2940563 RepID=UPI002476CC8A|nr:hypothetical protein [Paenibacillus sp. LBL]MDH6674372.1 hypothetical protein [Paenibacillus sp. LBL]
MKENENLKVEHYRYVGGHHFRRTSAVSAIGGKLLYYEVKCVNCGITGKRKDLQSPVERADKYADEKYDTCEKAER